ncbi:MAG: hypothetical protein ACRDIC_05975 [bacterium]
MVTPLHAVAESFAMSPEIDVFIDWMSIGYNEEGGNLMEGTISAMRAANRSERIIHVRVNDAEYMVERISSLQIIIASLDRKDLVLVSVRN